VHAALLAVVHPGDTPHGYNLTFAFPMLMFIIIAGALYLRFRGAHHVPGHVAFTSSRWARAGGGPGTVGSGDTTARSATASASPQAPSEGSGAPEEAAGEPAASSEQAKPADEDGE
jgi:hypothetical protein